MFVGFLFFLFFIHFMKDHLVDICWERAVCTVLLINAVLIIACVPFPFLVEDRTWNVIISVSDHCLVITFIQGYL